jgi:hypothetical protein
MMRLAAFFSLMVLPMLAQAAGPLTPDDHALGMDFSLRFASATMPLNYNGLAHDTTSRLMGVSLRQEVSQHITLGMYGGYAYVTQSGNPVTAGLELDGYHAGFSWHGILFASQHASLFYALDYTYQKVDHPGESQTVVMDWSQPQAQLGAIVALTKYFRVYGGGSYGRIDGEERVSGATNLTTDFNRAARAGGFLGFDLNTDVDGYIGVELRSGLTRGAEIYFKRRYRSFN